MPEQNIFLGTCRRKKIFALTVLQLRIKGNYVGFSFIQTMNKGQKILAHHRRSNLEPELGSGIGTSKLRMPGKKIGVSVMNRTWNVEVHNKTNKPTVKFSPFYTVELPTLWSIIFKKTFLYSKFFSCNRLHILWNFFLGRTRTSPFNMQIEKKKLIQPGFEQRFGNV